MNMKCMRGAVLNVAIVFLTVVLTAACGELTQDSSAGDEQDSSLASFPKGDIQSNGPDSLMPPIPKEDTVSEDAGNGGNGGNIPGGACLEGNPDDYPSCCDHGPGRCVPGENLDLAMHSVFGHCDDQSVCVPESLFERSGTFTVTSCDSILGLEGACVSKCSPQMAAFLDTLPQANCPETEL